MNTSTGIVGNMPKIWQSFSNYYVYLFPSLNTIIRPIPATQQPFSCEVGCVLYILYTLYLM